MNQKESQEEDKYELWGTFSVMDHLQEGAFLAEVIMYDRLVIPVPPDPARAETAADRTFAEKQSERWKTNGWDPARQKTLLEILKPVAVPVEWNRERHERWAAEYEKSKREAARQISGYLAGWKTGENLLDAVPAMAAGAVAVSPYNSLEDLKLELGITETSSVAERLQAGRGLPGNLVSAVIGREFLVPADPERDEFYLLREAVDLVQQQDYREARARFHTAQQRFIKGGKTDLESITTAVEDMAQHLEALHKVAQQRSMWTGLRRAYTFAQILTDALPAPANWVVGSSVKVALGLGKFTVDERLGNPADPTDDHRGGALLLDAQRRLKILDWSKDAP